MSKTTYPNFGEMLPKKDDIQLIVDSFKEEDRKRLTADGVFNPGIVNEVDEYLKMGSNENTLKILPFVAYTKSGNRIEVANTYDFLTINTSGEIVVDEDLNATQAKDIPYWKHYQKGYTNFTDAETQSTGLLITKLKPGSILQGIKLKHTQQFSGCGTVYISIGTATEPEKYTPKFLISDTPESNNIETSNILYSESSTEETEIYAYFTCSYNNLSAMISGSIDISLCITNVSNVEYEDEEEEGGIPLVNVQGQWKENMTYYIVARYTTLKTDERSLHIHNDDIDIDATPFYARITDDFKFYALRRTGSIIDPITDNDVKLGRVVTDNNGDITIYVNNYNSTTKTFDTDYLTLPSARFRNFAVADIEEYFKNKVNKTGDTMTGTLAFNNGNKISLLGAKTYNINSSVGNEQLNVVSNTGKGLIMAGADDTLYYFDGENRYRILNEGDGVANSDLSNLSNTGLSKFVLKEGDSMTGALYVPSPADDDNSTRVATTAWVNRILGSGKVLGRIDFDSGISASVTTSNSYTIPDDGYIFIIYISNDLKINDKTVITPNFGGTHLIPVSKNDVLTVTAGTTTITFCPQKTN